ncbi:MAG: hypothetical protein NZ908_03110, partial [Candidatus Micrarchaeota archaeon]|nr:hypothetical protein [Candidatus Micrarchaeota archaeon]
MIVTLFHNKKIIIETYLDYGTLVTTPDPNISGSTNSHLLGDYYRIRKRKDKSQFSMYHGLKTKIGYRAEIPYVITINTKHGPMMYFPKQYSIALELIHPTSSAELSNIPGRIKNLEAHVTRTPYIINSDGLVEIPDEHRVLQVLNNVLDTGRGIDPSLLKNRPFAGLVVIDPRGIEEVIARGNYSAKGEINLRPKMIVYTEDLDIYVINGMFAIAIPRNDNSNIPKDPIEGKELEELLKRLDLVGVIIHNIMGKKILDYRQLGDKDHVPVYIRDWFKEWKINSSELTGVLSYYPIIQRFGMHSIGYRPSGKERKALRKKKINPLRIHVYPEDLEGVLGEDGRIQMEELYRSLDIGNLARSFNTDYANLILAAAAQIIDRESLPNRIEEPTEMGKITSISTSAVDFLIRKELIPTARPISEPRSRLPPIIMIEGSEEIVQKALQILETHQYDLKIPAVKIWIDT